jgi:hypothetical protein
MTVAATTLEPSYTFRLSLVRRERTYRLTGRSLLWREGGDENELAFTDICRLRVYESRGARGLPAFRRCIITPRHGGALVLSSNHFTGGLFVSQMEAYQPFVAELLRRMTAANPGVELVTGFAMATWIVFATLLAAVAALYLSMLAGIAASFERDEIGLDIFLLIVIVAVAALTLTPMWRSVRRNFPRRLDPHAGAARDLLPGNSSS